MLSASTFSDSTLICDSENLNDSQLKHALGSFLITTPHFKTLAMEKEIHFKPSIGKEVDDELLEKHGANVSLALKTVGEKFSW